MRRAVRQDVIGRSSRERRKGDVIAMDEVDERFVVSKSVEQCRLHAVKRIPAHGRDLVLMARRPEPQHVGVEHAEAIGVALFRMAAQQLLPYADAEHGLRETPYNRVESLTAQIIHCACGLALSGKNHLVGRHYRPGVVGVHWFHAQPAQGVYHAVHIACIVFNDCYIHVFSFLGVKEYKEYKE